MTAARPGRWRRVVAILGALFLMTTAVLLADAWRTFGKRAAGARLERMQRSPQWNGSGFVNPEPLWNDYAGMLTSVLDRSPHGNPTGALPVQQVAPEQLAIPPRSGLRVTWLGHSTSLVELDGKRFLLDPVWGDRAFPWDWMGPRRWYAPLIALEDLPHVDAVLVSHDHHDHLQPGTIEAMRGWDTRFIVPLGVGAHLAYWGIPEARIVELDWWERTEVAGLQVVATPARHASGRQALDQNATLWAGFALLGSRHRVYYSGDTGLFKAMRDIGDKLGPFDLTLIEVGAYNRNWPDWHIGPEQAVRAHELVRGKALLPVHWGLWNLASHGWTEPGERALAAATAAGVRLLLPRPGESLEPGSAPPGERWWPELPWQSAQEHPIVSTRTEGLDERGG